MGGMKRIFILSIVLIGSVLAAADYTVTGDGAAIQKAIDAASAAGGGRVVVTPGVDFGLRWNDLSGG